MAEVNITIKSDISDVEKDVTKLSRELRDAKLAFKELEKGTDEYAKKKAEIDNLTKAFNSQKDTLKDLKDAHKENEKALKKSVEGFAEAKERMGDLKDEAILLQGSGVERLGNSFGLLREGLENADFDKVKTAFKGVGAAMSAIPIFLLIEGFKLLVENFDKVVSIAKTMFNAFSSSEMAVKSLTKELEKQQAINKGLTAGLEDEIKILEAQGASSAKILQKKRELNALKIKELEIDARLQIARIKEILDNDTLIDSYNRKAAAVLSSLGQEAKANEILKMIDVDKAQRAKEAADKVKEDIIAINHLKTEDRVNEIKEEKQHAKNKKEIARETAEDNRKAEKEERDFRAKLAKEEADKQIQSIKDANELFKQLSDEQDKADKKRKDDKEADEKLRKERGLEIEKNYAMAAANVATIFFDWQLQAAEGNEAKQLEIKKRAFQVEKSFRAVQATIDTVAAVQKTLATGGVLAVPLAISMGIAGAANVAKILSQKFNPGSTPTSSGGTQAINLSSGGGSGNPNAQPIPQSKQQSTEFDENGNVKGAVTKVVVLASDIKDVSRSVARVEQQSKF